MNAEVRLGKLLQNIDPQLEGEVYAFVALPEARLQSLCADCLCIFREREGLSAILPRALAKREGLLEDDAAGGYCQITLQVHSSLEAVGLTAVVSRELAAEGISANVVAALHHDHVFVPERDAQRALQILRGIGNRAQYS